MQNNKNNGTNWYYKIIYRGRYLKKILWILKIIAAVIINPFCQRLRKNFDYWLIGTGDDRYENNARAFYEYLSEKKDINVYWVAKNVNNIPIDKKYILKRASIKNYVYLLNSSVGLFSHSDSDIGPGLFKIIKYRKTLLVHLDHGYASIKRMKNNYYSSIHFDLLCSPSDFERNIKLRVGVPSNKIEITGFARCDQFHIEKVKKAYSKILFMPTWRNWYIDAERNYFKNDTFKNYKELFSSNEFIDFCTSNNLEIVYILHPTFSNYYGIEAKELCREFQSNIKVVTNEGDIRVQMQTSDVFVTDYSSMFFDFLYMEKDTLLFWFDEEEYKDRIGLEEFGGILDDLICRNADELLLRLKKLVNKGNQFHNQLGKYFYHYHDHKNCERIYHEIIKRC